MGFADLYKDLEQYVADEHFRYKMCFNVKRGIINTSELGGTNHMQDYFLGAAEILENLDSIDFRLLYAGHLSLSDLTNRKMKRKCIEEFKLPSFLNTPTKIMLYKDEMRKIGKINFILE